MLSARRRWLINDESSEANRRKASSLANREITPGVMPTMAAAHRLPRHGIGGQPRPSLYEMTTGCCWRYAASESCQATSKSDKAEAQDRGFRTTRMHLLPAKADDCAVKASILLRTLGCCYMPTNIKPSTNRRISATCWRRTSE